MNFDRGILELSPIKAIHQIMTYSEISAFFLLRTSSVRRSVVGLAVKFEV
jgi:hypothetical protein